MSFTAAEKTNLLALIAAGKAIRTGLGNVETGMSTSTTDETRHVLGELEHAMTEVAEGVVNATFYLFGVAAERGDGPRDALRLGPRSAYLAKAFAALDEALHEAHEAEEELTAAAMLRRDDSPYQLQLVRARFQVSQTVKLVMSFDRTLPYAEPDPLSILTLDQFFQSGAQYAYDIPIDLLSAWMEGPLLPLPEIRAISKALQKVWLFQGEVMAAAARTAGLDLGAPEVARQRSLTDLLQDAPQYLHVVNIALNALDAAATEPGRPLLRRGLTKAREDLSDSWRHLDFGAREVAR